jgi:hypothetical protein
MTRNGHGVYRASDWFTGIVTCASRNVHHAGVRTGGKHYDALVADINHDKALIHDQLIGFPRAVRRSI